MIPDNSMRNFDPRKVAHYEKENCAAYCEKDWLKLLLISGGYTEASEAVCERAMGMLYSDLWVLSGEPENSPLLKQDEGALYQSYLLLKEAIHLS